MGPYLVLQASLVGFFGFGATHYFILWLRSRGQRVLLLFALTCLFGSLHSIALFLVATALPESGQVARQLQGAFAFLSMITVAWLFAELSAFRPPWVVWTTDRVGGALLSAAAVILLVAVAISVGIDESAARPNIGMVAFAFTLLLIAVQLGRLSRHQSDRLAGAERRFRAIFDQTFQFIGLLDTQGTVLEANRTALAFAGIRSEDVIGRPFWTTPWWTHSPELQARLREAVHSATQGEVVRFEAAHPGSDGRLRHIDFSLKPVHDPAGVVTLLIPEGRDITERKETEDALRQSEERFRFLIQNQAEFVASCLPDGVLTFANDSYCRFFGLQPETVPGSSIIAVMAPEFREEARRALLHLTPDRAVESLLTVALAYGVERRWTEWTASGEFDEAGVCSRLQLTGRDIHDDVMAEEARRALERQLGQSRKMEALGHLAGGVAHDFNNLLTVIAGHTEQLLTDVRDEGERGEIVQIRLACERAASMTRQLLAFGRQSVRQVKVVDLNSVVDQAQTMLRRTIGEDIQLTVRTDAEAPLISGDPDQLGRVLLNLAVNARDAMPQGGQLVIETRKVRLDAPESQAVGVKPGPLVVLTVSDTGTGMTPETRARIFEPFFTTKEVGRGTGLGLAVVEGVIKQSGGAIDVTSELGAGTTFRIYLPAVDRGEAETIADREPVAAGGNETVLLVEDEDVVRGMAKAALERRGYTVLAASSGDEAAKLAREYRGRIDLMLTDVVMPGMSGLHLAERVRRDQPDLPVLFMGSQLADRLPHVALETAGADFIEKPFTPAELSATVRQALDRRLRRTSP